MSSNEPVPCGRESGYAAPLYDPQNPRDVQALQRIRSEVPHLEVVDPLELQLRDLIKLQHPQKNLTDQEYRSLIAEHLGDMPMDQYGNWVYYPWRRALVHILPKEEFVRVRTIRNAYKITFEEQALLATKTVGIIGLSVGQSAALAVAIERAAGEIRIADFDTLELSNLNRLRSGVYHLGLPKTHLVAREIAELDPYLPVKVFEEGIHEGNIEAFFTDGGRLDLLIEECDSIDIKVLAREYARKHRVPVLMDTSDRGMIDVERYDLDPKYPILHGLIDPNLTYSYLKSLKTSEEKLPIVAPILGIDTTSIRLRASILEVGQSITTWPQLGGDVMQGGALCVLHAKKILLSQSKESFRSFADQLDPNTKAISTIHKRFDDVDLWNAVKEYSSSISWSQDQKYNDISEELFKEITSAGSRASTPGNTQAFKWVLKDNTIYLVSDRSFEKAFSDNFGFGSLIGYGCVLENIFIYSSSIDHSIYVHLNEEFNPIIPNVILAIKMTNNSDQNKEYKKLALQIERRETTRNQPQGNSWSESELLHLKELSISTNCRIIQDPKQLRIIQELTSMADVIRMTNPAGFYDLFNEELIWDKPTYEKLREGILIDDLELEYKDKIGLSIYNDPRVNEFINIFNGGSGFRKISEKYLIGDQTICVFTSPTFNAKDLIAVGRNIQRFWLLLTEKNWSLQPFTSSIMISSYLLSDKNNYLTNKLSSFMALWSALMDELKPEGHIIFIAKITRHSGRIKANSIRKTNEQNTLVHAPQID
jgi:molybdopterin/thiamine biosynthesis adenylyltransferase